LDEQQRLAQALRKACGMLRSISSGTGGPQSKLLSTRILLCPTGIEVSAISLAARLWAVAKTKSKRAMEKATDSVLRLILLHRISAIVSPFRKVGRRQ
jgi:hypothetical protein